MLRLDGQVHHDTHAIPMGNYVIGVRNYVIVSPSQLGNYKIADTVTATMPSLVAQRAYPTPDEAIDGDPNGHEGDRHGHEGAEQGAMLMESCRYVFKEPGRWIFILRGRYSLQV